MVAVVSLSRWRRGGVVAGCRAASIHCGWAPHTKDQRLAFSLTIVEREVLGSEHIVESGHWWADSKGSFHAVGWMGPRTLLLLLLRSLTRLGGFQNMDSKLR